MIKLTIQKTGLGIQRRRRHVVPKMALNFKELLHATTEQIHIREMMSLGDLRYI